MPVLCYAHLTSLQTRSPESTESPSRTDRLLTLPEWGAEMTISCHDRLDYESFSKYEYWQTYHLHGAENSNWIALLDLAAVMHTDFNQNT